MPDTESMTGGQGLHGNSSTATAVSYSELLFSGDDDHLDAHDCFSFTSPLDNPPKMLCFGDSVDIYGLGYNKNAIKFVQKTEATTCTYDSSSSVPSTINSNSILPKKKKGNMGDKAAFGEAEAEAAAAGEVIKRSGDGNGAPAQGIKRNSKKAKSANNSLQITRHAKVKKAKLGERILALQQLVSPFGKTDTASVLHEAKGYITFLQQQVQLLCCPYLQPIHQEEGGEKGRDEEQVESRKDLRSRGLCLIPTGITSLHFTDDNGADYWSPANALVNPSS